VGAPVSRPEAEGARTGALSTTLAVAHRARPQGGEPRRKVTRARAALALFVIGATAGTALDAIHTHFGATAYVHPVALAMAWWTPLIFGASFVLGLGRPLLDRRPAPSWPRVGLGAAIFVLAYALTVAPLPWPVVAGLLIALFGVGWRVVDPSPVTLAIAAAGAVGGPAVESWMVAEGQIVHLHPVAFGVSGWLPALYLCAAVSLTSLAARLCATSPVS
jgi:hypothetical protein